MGCATPISPQHASDALPFGEALRCSNDLDATTSLPQVDVISKVSRGDVSGTSSDACTSVVLSNSIEPISPASLVTSASTERSPLAADLQIEVDGPKYSIGQVKVFDKMQRAIEPPYEARWEVIAPDIFDRVLSKLRRRRFGMRPNKPGALSYIQLMSAGATRDTSMPAVVVVIPKHIKMMQDFLNTDSTVQNLCKPRDGATVELQILACKGHSILIGRPGDLQPNASFSSDSDSDDLLEGEDSIISTDDSDNSEMAQSTIRGSEFDADFLSVLFENSNTYDNFNHGLGIRVVTKDGSRYVRGTCGGLLQLETSNHPPRQVGLLAGHILEQLKQSSDEATRDTCETASIIGDILYPKSSGEIPRQDWALFDAGKLSYKSSMANQRTLSIAQNSELPKENTAVTIRTSEGQVTGTLSSSTSGIMLNPDRGFVHVRMVIMHRGSLFPRSLLISSQKPQMVISGANKHSRPIGSTIIKGDSGAWVVHEGLRKVYGHIVATNSNGDAYMVPLHATITEIKASLGAVNVTLATSPNPTSQNRPTMACNHLDQRPIPPLETMKQTLPSVIPIEIKRLRELARTHLDKGEGEKAIPLLREVISFQEELPPGDESPLASKHELGRAYCKSGRFLEAIQVLKEVTQMRGEIHDETHPDCLASQHELAFAYMQSGQPSEAVKILKDVVKTQERVLYKANHLNHLNSQHELARAYLADGQASEAIKVIERVVAKKSSTPHESNPQLLGSQMVLAVAELMTSRASDAVKLLEHVIASSDATCSEHDELINKAREWLKVARQTALRPQSPQGLED